MKKFIKLLMIILLLTAGCNEQGHQAHDSDQNYTCPMHPQIVDNQPGTCPICGMDLVPVSKGGGQSGELMLSQSQIRLANIQTMQIAYGTAGDHSLLNGQLVIDETQNELISSRTAGRIEQLYIKETGQPVRKGQVLYALYSEELLSLQREYLLALEQNRTLGEEEPRFASFLASAKKKLLLYGLSERQITQLDNSGKLDPNIQFLAPASGVVTNIAVTEGQYVTEGSVLYRLAKLDKIWVEAEAYPQEAMNIKIGDPVQVQVQGYGQQPVTAKISFISPELRQGSQVVILRAQLSNTGHRLIPGMQANVRLPKQQARQLILPNDAVIRDEKGSHVWVQMEQGVYRARKVELGEAGFDSVAVLSGLSPEEQVVKSGAYLLYSEYILKKGGDPVADAQSSAPLLSKESPASRLQETIAESSDESFAEQAPEAFISALHEVTKNYLQIKDALVESNATAAAEEASSLLKKLESTAADLPEAKATAYWREQKGQLQQHAQQIMQEQGLEAKRAGFDHLSQTMIVVLEKFGVSHELFVQFCPMANDDKGAYWLSTESTIRNPYYGEAMLSCGEVVKKL
ncbi:MAG: efflux RND transporter periplasmic adaptor subunit [Bacteroidetes bacterium]|nr:efflux RND transporter periplasmic adaptor subunit [Bacteroidota bacterium]